MTNNDILRRIRYSFDLSDSQMIEIFALADKEVTRAEISDWLKKEEDPAYQQIYDKDFSVFLDGFINLKRGKREGPQPKPEKRLNNNIIFRKLKIALNLKDSDILEMFALAGLIVSKHEISAVLRNPSQSQFRVCKDQFLRKFVHGIQLKYRGDGQEKVEW